MNNKTFDNKETQTEEIFMNEFTEKDEDEFKENFQNQFFLPSYLEHDFYKDFKIKMEKMFKINIELTPFQLKNCFKLRFKQHTKISSKNRNIFRKMYFFWIEKMFWTRLINYSKNIFELNENFNSKVFFNLTFFMKTLFYPYNIFDFRLKSQFKTIVPKIFFEKYHNNRFENIFMDYFKNNKILIGYEVKHRINSNSVALLFENTEDYTNMDIKNVFSNYFYNYIYDTNKQYIKNKKFKLINRNSNYIDNFKLYFFFEK